MVIPTLLPHAYNRELLFDHVIDSIDTLLCLVDWAWYRLTCYCLPNFIRTHPVRSDGQVTENVAGAYSGRPVGPLNEHVFVGLI